MSAPVVHRSVRRPVVARARRAVRVSPPPPLVEAAAVPAGTFVLLPALACAALLVVALVGRDPLHVLVGGVFVLGCAVTGLATWAQARRRAPGRRSEALTRYVEHLGSVRRQLREAAQLQRDGARAAHPEPGALLGLVVDGTRVWERRRSDADFLHVRLGVARVPAEAVLERGAPDPGQAPDPAALEAVERLVSAHEAVDRVPLAVPLLGSTTTLVGDPGTARRVALAVVAQVLALHSPDDVRVAVCAPAGSAGAAFWSFLEWAPHTHHPAPDGRDEELLLTTRSAEELAALVRARAAGPALLVVVDGAHGTDAPLGSGAPSTTDPLADLGGPGVAQLRLVPSVDAEPARTDLSLHLAAGPDGVAVAPVMHRDGATAGLREVCDVRADLLTPAEGDVLVRRLASLRPARHADRGAGA